MSSQLLCLHSRVGPWSDLLESGEIINYSRTYCNSSYFIVKVVGKNVTLLISHHCTHLPLPPPLGVLAPPGSPLDLWSPASLNGSAVPCGAGMGAQMCHKGWASILLGCLCQEIITTISFKCNGESKCVCVWVAEPYPAPQGCVALMVCQ